MKVALRPRTCEVVSEASWVVVNSGHARPPQARQAGSSSGPAAPSWRLRRFASCRVPATASVPRRTICVRFERTDLRAAQFANVRCVEAADLGRRERSQPASSSARQPGWRRGPTSWSRSIPGDLRRAEACDRQWCRWRRPGPSQVRRSCWALSTSSWFEVRATLELIEGICVLLAAPSTCVVESFRELGGGKALRSLSS